MRFLDHELLAKAILESPQRLPISPQLLFYVLCRKVLRETPVKSREAADFVASVLEGFIRTARMEASDETGTRSMQYLSDIMHAMNNAGTREAFLLRSHAANYASLSAGSLRTTSRCGRASAEHPTSPSTRLSVR